MFHGRKQYDHATTTSETRTLKLTIPTRQNQLDPGVETRLQPLQDWVDGLPFLTPTLAAEQVRAQVQRLNRQPLPANQRLELLDLLANPYWRLFDALLATPQANASGADQAAAFTALQRCCQDLAFGYKIAVQDSLGKTGLFGSSRIRQRATLQAIRYLGQQLNHRYAGYQRPPDSLWTEIDQLYRHARQHGYHQTLLPGLPGESISIEQAFLAVVLLRIGDPFRLPAGGLWEVWRYLRHQSRLARLQPWEETGDQTGLVYLPATNPQSEGYRRGLGVRLAELIQGTRQHLEQLAQGDGAAKLGMSERLRPREARQILERLVLGWQQQVERKAERSPLQAETELVLGLEAAFCFLNRGLAFDRHAYHAPKEDGGEDEIDLGRLTAQWDPSREPGFPSLPCRTLNRSAGGIGLQCTQTLEKGPRVGQLIAIRSRPHGSEDPGPWFAATPRWLRVETHGFELGAQYLARDPLPVAVRILPPAKGSQEFHAALRTDVQQASRLWQILIAPPGVFAPGRHLELVRGGKREPIRCVKLLETGAGFERFQFEPL
jgi:hypothetical protein